MSQNKVTVIVGTRPELIKMQPIIKEIKTRNELELLLIHTGQHYDWNMSGLFIKELEMPQPDVFLNVKSCTHGAQIARIIARSERVLRKKRPNIVLVEGDTNSALGASLAASKLKIPIGHVEAGCRSFDKNMPEEINRILITDIASVHFAPTKVCVQNLLKEGIPKKHIHLTGHPIVDLLHEIQNKVNENVIVKYGVKTKQYYFVTIHREENVEHKGKLEEILKTLSELIQFKPVIFPIHPHTFKCIRRFKLDKYLKNLITIEPVSYLEALSLIKYARIALTDSGGIQQEAALLGTPCITFRRSTEWVETVNYGVNFLARSKEEIIAMTKKLENEFKEIVSKFRLVKNVFGKPYVSTRIVDIIEKVYMG